MTRGTRFSLPAVAAALVYKCSVTSKLRFHELHNPTRNPIADDDSAEVGLKDVACMPSCHCVKLGVYVFSFSF
jgi:hypothetical protein